LTALSLEQCMLALPFRRQGLRLSMHAPLLTVWSDDSMRPPRELGWQEPNRCAGAPQARELMALYISTANSATLLTAGSGKQAPGRRFCPPRPDEGSAHDSRSLLEAPSTWAHASWVGLKLAGADRVPISALISVLGHPQIFRRVFAAIDDFLITDLRAFGEGRVPRLLHG
jgi:hypothetical protein